MTDRALVRDELWRIERRTESGGTTLFRLRSEETGEGLEVVSPPDEVRIVFWGAPTLDRRALSPFGLWHQRHEILRLAGESHAQGALHAGRIRLEPYQLVPARRLLSGPHRSLLIADDVGLGKTIEAGLCILELMGRRVAQRVLLVVPPGLVDQWLEEMERKFGFVFRSIADSASLDAAQTALAEGISPWVFHDRVITSIEYLKRPGVWPAALRRPWDVIVVDEAHYLAESGSPANPYGTQRTRLGRELRKATRALVLLTATPHNGYRHSFRSLLELIEPTDAALVGGEATVRARVARCMVRRLKRQITKSGPDGSRIPAFVPRAPVEPLQVTCESAEEREVFELVTGYCAKTLAAAADSEQRDLVSFAMQIVKKRMLSTRRALAHTVAARLDALKAADDAPGPSRKEVRELQGDLPLPEEEAERVVSRVLNSSVPREARRRKVEARQLREVKRALDRLDGRPDPKITRLLGELRSSVLDRTGERAIVFTEYRDSLAALREALEADVGFRGHFVELTGGLTARQRRDRIARFSEPDCLVLLATDAASEGLNLQRYSRRLYHLELPWNPNRLEQRNGRIDRYGQTRTPRIAYLCYADSPEDRVLERLVQRISNMHDDRVSTPDIVGIVEAARLPDRLLSIEVPEDEAREAQELHRIFDDEYAVFAREVAPLLVTPSGDSTPLDATSADTLLGDDLEFEVAMLGILGSAATARLAPHEYRIDVPVSLQGPGVKERYDSATFRRSVALQEAAEATEFVHRLHPLARTATAMARDALRISSTHGPSLPPFLCVRRLASLTDGPGAVFSFLDRSNNPDGDLFCVGVLASGEEMDAGPVSEAMEASDRPGEVPWGECLHAFEAGFRDLQRRALAVAQRRAEDRIADERARREALAEDLRLEVAAFRSDRLRELEVEEAAERAGTREQTELFREVRIDWAARRAAVATQAEARLTQIASWAAEPEPAQPEPVGVLLVFPEGLS